MTFVGASRAVAAWATGAASSVITAVTRARRKRIFQRYIGRGHYLGMAHVTASSLAYAHPGGDLLFSDVSFHVSPGDHVGMVGANGVGKSTLFRVITGELPADDGEVRVGGRLGYMPQGVGGGGEGPDGARAPAP